MTVLIGTQLREMIVDLNVWQRSPIAAAEGRDKRCWWAWCVTKALGLLPGRLVFT
jgi:hypothetical protein